MNRQQRRAAKATVRRDPVLNTADALSRRAHAILTTNLRGFGNVLSEEHAEALMRVVGGMSLLATGGWERLRPQSSRRLAYSLDTGLGKSESVVALLAAIHQLGLPLSVVVAASKVEDLARMSRRLADNGVPADAVAVWHSKELAPTPELLDAVRAGDPKAARKYASVPSAREEDLHSRPFLLCSHERIRRGGDVSYRGGRRSLVVWDEALLTSSAKSVDLTELRALVAWLGEQRAAREEGSPLRSALAWLTAARAELVAEQERQEREPGSSPRMLYLPPLMVAPEEADEWAEALESECRKPRSPDAEAALTLLAHGPATPVRVLRALKERAMVSFEVTVPDHLAPIAILDASYPLKELERMDRTIEEDPWLAGRTLKRYANVTGHLWRTASGRGALEKALDPRTAKGVARVIDEVVKVVTEEIPPTEAVLFFTHLPKRRVNVAETLKEALAHAGVKLDDVLPDGRPRFAWLTYGSETSANDYSRTENVVFVGAFFRGDADVAAAIAGQKRDLLGDVDTDEVTRVIRSETAHSIYQGLSRGACRVVERGEARPMRFWLMLPGNHAGPIVDLLSWRMPGLVWRPWVDASLPTSSMAAAIGEYLDGLPSTVSRVSSREVKAGAGLEHVASKSYQRARDAALAERPGWQVDGQSFVRVVAAADAA